MVAAQPHDGQATQDIVFRGWGVDKPGIAEAFTKVVTKHDCRVLDMAQFLLEGSIMFTFVLNSSGGDSVGLMKELTQCATERGLRVSFHFPDVGQVEAVDVAENIAVLSIVSKEALTPALLFNLDAVLCKHGCVVHEIEHRSDNKRDNNGEFNKVQIRFSCPPGLKLATLIMGAPSAFGGCKAGLQKVAWDYGAEVTVRWWDAMNRPNGKSLVVFGLSNVLYPCDVLDQVLQEAGLDPGAAHLSEAVWQHTRDKVAMLKGQSPELIQKVIERLDFTPGARLVCGALKRMGFRMAVLTNTGVRDLADHVQRQLGLDYCICQDLKVVEGKFTGEYTGDLSDVRFRKADLLKLMAEREGIDYRNVIVVGEPLKGLKAANARLVMETFGPNIWFNSDKLRDLTIALYLLGFNGSDVRALRKRRWEDGPLRK